MDNKVISGDTHVDLAYLPEDLFVSNASSGLKDLMPRVVDTDKGPRWKAENVDLGRVGMYTAEDMSHFTAEMIHRLEAMKAAGFLDDVDKGHHPTTPELRIGDQDKDGVVGEVIYGLFSIATQLDNAQQIAEVFRIYNEWIADFCNTHSDRLAGLACLPAFDAGAAGDELRRSARLGLKGGEFMIAEGAKPAYHRDWDHLWSAASETGLPISFHTTGITPKLVDKSEADSYRQVQSNITLTIFQLSGAELLASVIFSGACERFPNFKFVLGECGVSWLPYVLDRMDHESRGQADLKMRPSEYWHQQGYSTFQEESVAGDLVHLIGEDTVIWGSDYPHPDGVWPDSRAVIENNFKNLKSETALRKITCDNTAKLYGFPLPA